MRYLLALVGFLCLQLAGDGALGQASPAPRAVPAEPWLEVASPAPGTVLRQVVPLVEVRGRAGLGGILEHDVVIVLDFSASTLEPTGLDVDGDGIVGSSGPRHYQHPRTWTTDYDDTIVRAEILAAERLTQRLDPATTRVGLVTFAARAKLRAPVGPPAAVLAVLPKLGAPKTKVDTSIARGIDLARETLDAAPDGEARRRTILLLSDGVPTIPLPRKKAEKATLVSAEAAARAGVAIHAYALGPEAAEAAVYRQVAETTGGRFVPVESPGEVVHHLAAVSLSGLEDVAVRNATTGAPGEAVRVFPDGSFDAYVRLAVGENLLEVTARTEGGGAARETRTVVFSEPEVPTPGELEEAEALRTKLRLRTTETELAIRARAGREKQERDLDVTLDEE